ncbi:hypothetical protein C2G38_2196109 [Gigaspora rosea]|uniref:Uncharacterized protein n=1 Tax=Gigaspora rosea TaxID=44941 RepID=A0A397V2D6_9GLOM|nr:hypothetical protein C2G38_2196109 [Gigaspora rosea]
MDTGFYEYRSQLEKILSTFQLTLKPQFLYLRKCPKEKELTIQEGILDLAVRTDLMAIPSIEAPILAERATGFINIGFNRRC